MDSNRRTLLLYSLLACVTVALVLPILLLPLSSDNDIYQSMAFAMAKGKGLPYLGSWDHNFPGVVLYHWLSIKLFGVSDLSFRMIDVVNRLGIAYVLYRIARDQFSKEVAWLAPILVVSIYSGSGIWNAGQRDGFATFWILVALLHTMKFHGERWRVAVIAPSICLAAMIRPTNVIFILPFACYLVYLRQWKTLAGYVVLFVFSLIIVLMPWILREGGLSQFYYSAIRFNLDLYSPERNTWDNALASLMLYLPLVVVGTIGSLAYLYRLGVSKHFDRASWSAVYLLLGVVAIVTMGKYHIYHFEIILPILILFVLFLLYLSSRSGTRLILASFIGVVFLAAYFPRQLTAQFVKNGGGADAAAQIARNLASFEGYSLQTERSITQRLDRYPLVDGDVEFALLWPGLRWRSGHPGITRFTTSYALTLPAKSRTPEYQLQWIHEYDSVLSAAMPKFVVAALGPEYLAKERGMSSDAFLHSLDRFGKTLTSVYTIDTAIGGYKLYRRNDVAPIK